MNDLKKYEELKNEKQTEMSDLVEKVKLEERAMTEEENSAFDELEKEIEAINSTIEKINKSRKLTEENKEKGATEMKEENKEKIEEEKRELEKRDLENFGKYIRNEYLEEKTENYNSKFTYGLYQIDEELNTSFKNEKKETIYNYPELNGDIKTIKYLLKEYYLTEIVPTLFVYEFLK